MLIECLGCDYTDEKWERVVTRTATQLHFATYGIYLCFVELGQLGERIPATTSLPSTTLTRTSTSCTSGVATHSGARAGQGDGALELGGSARGRHSAVTTRGVRRAVKGKSKKEEIKHAVGRTTWAEQENLDKQNIYADK